MFGAISDVLLPSVAKGGDDVNACIMVELIIYYGLPLPVYYIFGPGYLFATACIILRAVYQA